MRPVSAPKKFFLLLLLLIGPGLILIYLSKGENAFQVLPYYGEKIPLSPGDTIFHQVPDFQFIDQDGHEVTMDSFQGDILVVDFFFTTCPTICPIMTKQMTRLQWLLDDPAYADVHLLSHTVNPENDTPEVLKKYGESQGADFSRWTFVTGDQEEIFDQGFEGYLLSTQEDAGAPGGFLHSSYFVLVDKNRNIRGFYDGTSTKEVDDLFTDIKMLKKEEVLKESEKVRS